MFFGKAGAPLDLSRHALRIFAEIVAASQMSLEAVLARAEVLRVEGADVVDLGCLPDTSFPHLEDAVRELKARGLAVSVDSADPNELLRGGAAGADYVLSLTGHSLAIAEETGARPVLIPAQHGDLASLYRAAEEAQKRGLSAILDPVIDPIHFGFTESLSCNRDVRARLPDAEMLMGTGNLTELTDADSVGVTACCSGSVRSSLSPTCSPSMSARTLAARFKCMTRRGALCTPGPRITACREAMGGRCCRSTTRSHFHIRVGRSLRFQSK